MSDDPESFTREWLKSQGVKCVDVLPPRSSMDGNIRIVARISKTLEPTFLKLCGREGILTGKFFETDEDRAFFSVVPLVNTTREEALKRAAYHGSDTWGVVPPKNSSWGVRVLSEMYEEAVKKIQPDDHATILGRFTKLGAAQKA